MTIEGRTLGLLPFGTSSTIKSTSPSDTTCYSLYRARRAHVRNAPGATHHNQGNASLPLVHEAYTANTPPSSSHHQQGRSGSARAESWLKNFKTYIPGLIPFEALKWWLHRNTSAGTNPLWVLFDITIFRVNADQLSLILRLLPPCLPLADMVGLPNKKSHYQRLIATGGHVNLEALGENQ